MRMLWVWSGVWEGPPPPVHFLNFISLLVCVSPPCASLRVVLPSSQYVSSVGQGLCWLCTGRMRTLWVWSGAWECPPPVHFLNFISLLVYVSPPCASLRVVLPSSQYVSSVGQGLCWLCTGRMRTLWVWSGAWECPPPVHFLNFISVLVYVSPPCASLPCHASFLAARSEFSWARVVLAVHRPHEDVMGLEWCVGMPPTPLVHFLNFISQRSRLPTTRPLPCHASFAGAGSEYGWRTWRGQHGSKGARTARNHWPP